MSLKLEYVTYTDTYLTYRIYRGNLQYLWNTPSKGGTGWLSLSIIPTTTYNRGIVDYIYNEFYRRLLLECVEHD